METRPPDNDHPEIIALRKALADAELVAEKARNEWSHMYDQHKTLREEQRQLQHDYEQLRVQKGGFGFKMLLFAGFMGTLVALAGCFVYLKLKPKDPHALAFERFKHNHAIEYELAISKGNLEEVEQSLRQELENPDNQAIYPEISFIRQLITTAKRSCK